MNEQTPESDDPDDETLDSSLNKAQPQEQPMVVMKDEFDAAEKYFRENPTELKYSRTIHHLEHTFVKIFDSQSQQYKILARMETIDAGAKGKVKLYTDEQNRKYAVKTPLPGESIAQDKAMLAIAPSSDPKLAKKGKTQLIGIMELISRKSGQAKEYVVMEYIKGKDLTKSVTLPYYIRDSNNAPEAMLLCSTYPETARYKILLSYLKKLQSLHNKGVLHLDTKPHNMMLYRDGGNFDANVIDLGESEKCKKGKTLYLDSPHGSPHYQPPEVKKAIDEKDRTQDDTKAAAIKYPYSAASDIYMLGVVASENLGLQDEIVKQMLADDPKDRPSIEALIKAIEPKAKKDLTPDEIKQIEKLEIINKQGATLFALAELYNENSPQFNALFDALTQFQTILQGEITDTAVAKANELFINALKTAYQDNIQDKLDTRTDYVTTNNNKIEINKFLYKEIDKNKDVLKAITNEFSAEEKQNWMTVKQEFVTLSTLLEHFIALPMLIEKDEKNSANQSLIDLSENAKNIAAQLALALNQINAIKATSNDQINSQQLDAINKIYADAIEQLTATDIYNSNIPEDAKDIKSKLNSLHATVDKISQKSQSEASNMREIQTVSAQAVQLSNQASSIADSISKQPNLASKLADRLLSFFYNANKFTDAAATIASSNNTKEVSSTLARLNNNLSASCTKIADFLPDISVKKALTTLSEKFHDKALGRGSFKHQMNNLDDIAELKEKLKNNLAHAQADAHAANASVDNKILIKELKAGVSLPAQAAHAIKTAFKPKSDNKPS